MSLAKMARCHNTAWRQPVMRVSMGTPGAGLTGPGSTAPSAPPASPPPRYWGRSNPTPPASPPTPTTPSNGYGPRASGVTMPGGGAQAPSGGGGGAQGPSGNPYTIGSNEMIYEMGHTAYDHVGDDSSTADPSTLIFNNPLQQASGALQVISVAAMAAAAYHGYKRNSSSVGWAIGWGLLAGLSPAIAIGVALAEGFGKPKRSAP